MIGVVCENDPEVADTVMVYVPAGVPVVVVVELCPPQAGCNRTRVISARKNRPPIIRRRLFKRLPIPSPRKARPVTGSTLASSLPPRMRPAVVVTLGNVLITSVTVEGLEPWSVTGLVEGVQVVPPPGRPEEHAIEIEAVNTDNGVIWMG